jgi:hypothetical protein
VLDPLRADLQSLPTLSREQQARGLQVRPRCPMALVISEPTSNDATVHRLAETARAFREQYRRHAIGASPLAIRRGGRTTPRDAYPPGPPKGWRLWCAPGVCLGPFLVLAGATAPA